jgi:hypothetical protein
VVIVAVNHPGRTAFPAYAIGTTLVASSTVGFSD